MNGLLTHCGAQHVSMADLATLPDPAPMGRFHKPVRHDEFVAALLQRLTAAGYRTERHRIDNP